MSTRSCRVQHGSTLLDRNQTSATALVSILDASIAPGQAFVITSLRTALAAPNRALVIPTLQFHPLSRIQFATYAATQRTVRVAWSVVACRSGLNVTPVEFVDSAIADMSDFAVVRSVPNSPSAYVRAVKAVPALKAHSFVVAHMYGVGSSLNEDEMFCIMPRAEDLQLEVTYFRTQPQSFRLRAQVITWDAVASNSVYDGNGIGLSVPPANSVLFSSACVTGFTNGPVPFAVSGFFTFTVTEIGTKSSPNPDLLSEPVYATQQDLGSTGNNPSANRRVVLQTVVFGGAVEVKYQVLQLGSASLFTSNSFVVADVLPVLMTTQGLCPSTSLTTPIGPSLLAHLTYDNVSSSSSRIVATREDTTVSVKCPMAMVDISGLFAPTTTTPPPTTTLSRVSVTTMSVQSTSSSAPTSAPTISPVTSTSPPPTTTTTTTTTTSVTTTTVLPSLETTTTTTALLPTPTTTSLAAPTTTILAPVSTASNATATTALFAPSTAAANNFDAALIGGIVGGALALILVIVAAICLARRRGKTKRKDDKAIPLESESIISPVAAAASSSSHYEFLPMGPSARASGPDVSTYGIGELST